MSPFFSWSQRFRPKQGVGLLLLLLLPIPPLAPLSLGLQLGIILSALLLWGLLSRRHPMLPLLLLLLTFRLAPLLPEGLSWLSPHLIPLALLIAAWSLLKPEEPAALGLALVAALTGTEAGILGATLYLAALLLSQDLRGSPKGSVLQSLMALGGPGLPWIAYALWTAVGGASWRLALLSALPLLLWIAWRRRGPFRPQAGLLALSILLSPLLPASLALSYAEQMSRESLPCDDRWGWRQLWKRTQEHPEPDAGLSALGRKSKQRVSLL